MKKIILILTALFSINALAATPALTLPKDIKWVTNDSDLEFASPDAKRGGTLRTSMLSFPLTIRRIGPDSNGSFRSYFDIHSFALVEMHPNTQKFTPALATHWAFDKDKKTIYYKLRKEAKWSDGKPITADDYQFTLELMRSEHIKAPWYNNYYTEWFDHVIKYDDYTIAVVAKKPKPTWERLYSYNLSPTPKHFYKIDKNFVKNYNWKVAPVEGPYVISKIKKGKNITLSRVKNWWGDNLKYFRNRYNVDKIRIKVIRDLNVRFEHFKKGKIDYFPLTLPLYWHKNLSPYNDGYINKYWLYNDRQRAQYGLLLNLDDDLFKDINVRKGLAHSLNIEKINKTILRGDYERLQSYGAGTGAFSNKKVRARIFDLKKADDFFKKAGWDKRGPDGIRIKNGKKLKIKISTGYGHHKERLVIIKEEAKKAGIEINLQILDGAAGWKLVQEKKHQAHWAGTGAYIRPGYRQSFHSINAHKPQTNNMTNTDDPEMDKLIEKYRDTFDEKKKAELSRTIIQKIHDNAAFIPTFLVPYYRVGAWKWITLPKKPNTKISDSLLEFGLFWIDQKVKKETEQAMKSGKKFKPQTITDETYRVK